MQSFLRGPVVSVRTGLSRTTIWRLVKKKKFPKPVPITDDGYAVGWVESEVEEWIQTRIQQRDRQQARVPVSIRRKAG
jgi:prophage regulatory protein